jgi:flagellar operon protein
MANELFIPKVGPIQAPQGDLASRGTSAKDGAGFDRLFRDALTGQVGGAALKQNPSELKFSAHAMNRIRERSIPMGGDMMQKLEKAVDTAAQKGSKESLILSKDAAFIVSVKNKTVITVVGRDQMEGNVFTNIDSTVVL